MLDARCHQPGQALRTLEVVSFHQILTNGGHHPLLFQMRDGGGSAGLWVLKPQLSASAANTRPGLSVIAELAGLEACGWFDVCTPAGGLLRMPADAAAVLSTVPASARFEVGEIFSLNQGLLAYCSRYIEGSARAEPALLPRRPSQTFVAQAARLLLLDVFLFHHDRQIDNENALLLGDELIAIDHGDALAGLNRPGETGTALAGRTVIPPSVKAHFLLAWLRIRAHDVDWSAITADLARINAADVANLVATIPHELGSAEQNNAAEIYSRIRPFFLRRLEILPEIIDGIRAIVGPKP